MQSVNNYLRLTDPNRRFSYSILKILTEDRRAVHTERINNNQNIVQLIAGVIVMVRSAVQNDAFKNKVVKLSY